MGSESFHGCPTRVAVAGGAFDGVVVRCEQVADEHGGRGADPVVVVVPGQVPFGVRGPQRHLPPGSEQRPVPLIVDHPRDALLDLPLDRGHVEAVQELGERGAQLRFVGAGPSARHAGAGRRVVQRRRQHRHLADEPFEPVQRHLRDDVVDHVDLVQVRDRARRQLLRQDWRAGERHAPDRAGGDAVQRVLLQDQVQGGGGAGAQGVPGQHDAVVGVFAEERGQVAAGPQAVVHVHRRRPDAGVGVPALEAGRRVDGDGVGADVGQDVRDGARPADADPDLAAPPVDGADERRQADGRREVPVDDVVVVDLAQDAEPRPAPVLPGRADRPAPGQVRLRHPVQQQREQAVRVRRVSQRATVQRQRLRVQVGDARVPRHAALQVRLLRPDAVLLPGLDELERVQRGMAVDGRGEVGDHHLDDDLKVVEGVRRVLALDAAVDGGDGLARQGGRDQDAQGDVQPDDGQVPGHDAGHVPQAREHDAQHGEDHGQDGQRPDQHVRDQVGDRQRVPMLHETRGQRRHLQGDRAEQRGGEHAQVQAHGDLDKRVVVARERRRHERKVPVEHADDDEGEGGQQRGAQQDQGRRDQQERAVPADADHDEPGRQLRRRVDRRPVPLWALRCSHPPIVIAMLASQLMPTRVEIGCGSRGDVGRGTNPADQSGCWLSAPDEGG